MPDAGPVPSPENAIQTAYSMQQVTQTTFNTAIPSHVWTPEVLSDLHAKQHDVSVRQIDLDGKRAGYYNEHRIREGRFGWAAFALIAVVIAASLYMVVAGDSSQAAIGSHIIAATVAFLGGYMAGHGQGKAANR